MESRASQRCKSFDNQVVACPSPTTPIENSTTTNNNIVVESLPTTTLDEAVIGYLNRKMELSENVNGEGIVYNSVPDGGLEQATFVNPDFVVCSVERQYGTVLVSPRFLVSDNISLCNPL